MTNQLRLLFLFVVISGALCTVEDYVIMSQCAHNKAIYLAAEGTVSVTDISQTQNITIVGRPDFVNNNFKIALYAKETQRYLCFNDHWKLVGMKELQDTCYFNEAIVHGYFVFRSVVDMQRRIGFTQRGRAVGPKKTVNDACYMFTKIPTDQFFHQHTHFSAAPKTKSTTTKIPKTEYTYTHTPYTTQAGRGSGGGRTKTNRFKNPQRQEDAVAHNHSGHGHGSGSGSGGGSGSGNGSKKFKKQRNGNKQQRQQKQKQEMQQQIRGHSYNLSNPKNSTYLNSSRQNLLLSQHSINNHTNKKHNNNNNNNSNNNNNHPPQNHQVRHHHNDPNKVARRQQHDQKQKTKLRQRVRPSPSSASAALTPAVAATTTTTTATTSLTTAKLINSSKPHHTLSSSYSDIHPTSVIPTISTDATSDIQNTMSSTLVVAKRKGRRRKGDKLHKKGLQKKLEQERQHSREQTEKEQAYSSSVGPAYDEEEEFITSSTDYAWMINDITMSAVKPTSASLPSWDTWYPSSSTAYTEDEDADYTLGASATASSATEANADARFSTTLESSSSMTDLDKNTLSSQTSVPLPTSVFTTTLTENSIDETISPTVTTTDLGTTTTNTSTYTQTDFWSTSLNDNTDADMLATGFTSETFNTYATPQLENTQNTLNTDEALLEATNALSTQHSTEDSENSTAAITLSTIEDDNDEEHEVSSPPTERTSDEVSEDTTWLDGSTSEMTSSGNYEKSYEAATTTTTTTYTNDCAYSTASTHNGSKTMTDCMFATKTTAPIANNHKTGETTPLQYTTQSNNDIVPKMEAANKVTTSTALNSIIIPIRSDKTTSLPETTSTTTQSHSHSQSQSSTQFSKIPEPAPATPLQPVEKSIHTTFTEINTAATTSTATASSSTAHVTKSPVPLALTTRKTLRKSTQKLLATPFHQLTYVRNEAGDIDIDSIDNISIYPELLDNDNDEPLVKPSTSRLTMISGYLPTSATATLPESIRIAKIKINRERKRMLRLRNVGNYA